MSSEARSQPTASPAPRISAGQQPGVLSVETELGHLQASWRWLWLLGIVLMVCGVMSLIYPVITSLSAVVVLGTLLVVAGIANIVGAFWAGKWSGFLLEVLAGVFYIVLGAIVNDRPGQAALAITLLVASLFIVIGLFRIVVALVLRLPQWGWFLLNGVVTLLCGVVIYRHFPESALWVIGLLVSLELLFHGWTWVAISLVLRDMKEDAEAQSA